MKKAEGLPLNTIIIAIIAILVLVVLAVVFSKSAQEFVFGSKSCTATYRGACQEKCNEGEASYTRTDCQKIDSSKPFCCVAVEKQEG